MNILNTPYKQRFCFVSAFYINPLKKERGFYKLNRFANTTNINIL